MEPSLTGWPLEAAGQALLVLDLVVETEISMLYQPHVGGGITLPMYFCIPAMQ